mgnify:FL=1|tara:strand:- start:705 stop:899 length:195 start_codon:yes stop_codon:yes gene_type:complete
MGKSAVAQDKRPAMAFDKRKEVRIIINALETYRNEYAVESIDYTVDIEELVKEFEKVYKLFDKD